jgi:hypothetical protein
LRDRSLDNVIPTVDVDVDIRVQLEMRSSKLENARVSSSIDTMISRVDCTDCTEAPACSSRRGYYIPVPIRKHLGEQGGLKCTYLALCRVPGSVSWSRVSKSSSIKLLDRR